MKFCPNCGTEVIDGADSFCRECGKPLTVHVDGTPEPFVIRKQREEETRERVEWNIPQSNKETAFGYDGYYDDVLPEDADHSSHKPQEDQTLKWKIGAIIAGVLLAGAACVLFLLFQ